MECRDGNVVAPHFDMLDTDACFKQHLFLRQAPRQTQFPQPVGYVTDKFFVSGNSYHNTKNSKSQIHYGKHGKIDPVGTDEIDPVKTA